MIRSRITRDVSREGRGTDRRAAAPEKEEDR
ncbi:hypothetical protein SAMN06297382_0735 [Amphiplicatus metriothermophilus]|uniref:Uncharacterized protein n=1 Tax=Amphiplicatus metriothermophilus TaxID=1519374 RepID=A0A239PMA2_9PROT|nr:hypothetical protein [Amphiplicatus metriothermophilus]SNT68234.1 hypothetical protein SAMN06297382_0735 [Amphiplicatus metriothermophilus]